MWDQWFSILSCVFSECFSLHDVSEILLKVDLHTNHQSMFFQQSWTRLILWWRMNECPPFVSKLYLKCYIILNGSEIIKLAFRSSSITLRILHSSKGKYMFLTQIEAGPSSYRYTLKLTIYMNGLSMWLCNIRPFKCPITKYWTTIWNQQHKAKTVYIEAW
jgi:hypothetical protein